MLCLSFADTGWGESVDPTLPIDFVPPASLDAGTYGNSVSVNMIMVRGEQSFALVNGQFVRVNDTVGNAKVTAIGRNYIELKGDGGAVKHYLAGYRLNTEIKR